MAICRDEPAKLLILMQKMSLVCLKLKKQIPTGKTGNNGRKDVEIMLVLKYLSYFWRNPELALINCKINLDLT